MEKTIYNAPSVIVREIILSASILNGSDYGAAGKAGSDLDVLDELSF